MLGCGPKSTFHACVLTLAPWEHLRHGDLQMYKSGPELLFCWLSRWTQGRGGETANRARSFQCVMSAVTPACTAQETETGPPLQQPVKGHDPNPQGFRYLKTIVQFCGRLVHALGERTRFGRVFVISLLSWPWKEGQRSCPNNTKKASC